MQYIKSFFILISFIVYLAVATVAHLVLSAASPPRRWPAINALTLYLIKTLKFILGIKIKVKGHKKYLQEHGNLIICKHVGYIDGIVLGSLFPATFVSKKETKSWPIIGKVIELGGTVFINRQKRNAIAESLNVLTKRLQDGMNVIIFPEGTSTNGKSIHSFQTSFFGLPIQTQSPLLPVTVTYHSLNNQPIKNFDEIYWYGTMKFETHLWNLLKYKSIEVSVTIHDKISISQYPSSSTGRKSLAQDCRYKLQTLEGFVPLRKKAPSTEETVPS